MLSSSPRFFAPRNSFAPPPLLVFIVFFTLAVAALMVRVPFALSGAIVLGLALFITAFISTEAGLYAMVFSMLLSPEIGAGGLEGDSATTASRGVTLRAEDLLLVILGFAWLGRTAVHKDLGLVRKTPLNKPIAHYVIACLFATSMGFLIGHVNGMTGFFYVLKYIEYFVIYFLVVNNLHSREQVQRFTIALLLTALIVALTAIVQIPTGQRVSAPFEGERGEPNTLGGYLLFVGTIAASLAMQLDKGRIRWLLWGLVGLMLAPFLATLSRGSYLALPFAYLALVVFNPRRRALMIALLVGAVVLGGALVPRAVVERISYTFSQRTQAEQFQVGGVELDTSTTARIHSWQQALNDSMESPLWGFGVTGYGFLDAQYPRILVETGLLGVLCFALLIAAVFRQALQVFKSQDPLYRGLAMGLAAGLVGLLVHGVGANTFIIVRVMEPFWLVVGLVVCAGRLEAERTD